MAEDILWRIQKQTSVETVTFNDVIYNEALVDLVTREQAMGGQGIATFGLSQPEQAANNLANEYMWEINYDTEEMTANIANKHKLMDDQLDVYNTIISSTDGERDLFFLDAPGGTGNL